MRNDQLPPLRAWLAEPMEPAVAEAVTRLRRAPSLRRIAVMPDVHLASDVCVGIVLGTEDLLYPQAVGGDIGCGMLSVAFDAPAGILADPVLAAHILAELGRAVPVLRHHRASAVSWPEDLRASRLSHGSIEAVRRGDGVLQLGTLGSGNHFIEFQADEADDSLWLTIHSGSRCMGQAIRAHHMAQSKPVGSGFYALDVETDAGRAYLADVAWARRYAEANRLAIATAVERILVKTAGTRLCWPTAIHVDHNHVRQEQHRGARLWIHRKGAMPADAGAAGVLPGSMGTQSFHIEGLGEPESLRSSAHGAGRAMSRQKARCSIHQRDLHRQMQGVWYDYRNAGPLREEAPAAYKDVRAVMRAQRDLVKTVRTLRPVLNYKGR